jgi:hypothetical protein
MSCHPTEAAARRHGQAVMARLQKEERVSQTAEELPSGLGSVDPGQVAEAVQTVLGQARQEKEAGREENAWALVEAAAGAAGSLRNSLDLLDPDPAVANEGSEVEKAEFPPGHRRVGVPMPSRYADESPVPLIDPEASHAFIGHAKNPSKCVACGKDLGHDNHWTMAPVYKAEELEEDSFQVLPGEDTPVWLQVEKNETGKLQGLVYGVVLHPQGHDAHGDRVEPEEIQKAAHGWMRRSRQLGDQHFLKAGADVVESYIAPVSFRVKRPDGEMATVPRGSWIAVTKVEDPKLLRDIATGKKSGYSIGGSGVRDKDDEGEGV